MSVISLMLGLLIAISAYLLMSTQFIRWLYGLVLFSSVINIFLLISGRVFLAKPSFIDGSEINKLANPLPQALILTAIVISFALIALSLVILRELYQKNSKLNDIAKPKNKRNDLG